MEFTFECACGEELSSLTRGGSEARFTYECDGCGTRYAVTITPIDGPYSE